MQHHRARHLFVASVVGIAMTVLWGWVSPAYANFPSGACCLPDRTCEELVDVPCAERGGQFIGEGTMCASIDCSARVAAPVLSIFGLVGAIGALGGIGVYRLVRRRR